MGTWGCEKSWVSRFRRGHDKLGDKKTPHRVRKTGKVAQLGGSRISTGEEESIWGPGLDAKCQTCGQRLSRIEMEPFSSDIYEICPDLHRHQMKQRGVIL